jgi:hypothetical protein
MKLCTTSETISFAKDLEQKSGEFYEGLSQRYEEGKAVLPFVEENRKFAIQIQRAYQSVITDAIEGCYAFKLESDAYTLDLDAPVGAGWADVVNKAIAIEERIIDFYITAAEQSMALMADIPRNFKIVAKKRKGRLEKLRSLV